MFSTWLNEVTACHIWTSIFFFCVWHKFFSWHWTKTFNEQLQKPQLAHDTENDNDSDTGQRKRNKAGFDHLSVLIGPKRKAEGQKASNGRKCNKMHCFHYNDLCCTHRQTHITHRRMCCVQYISHSLSLSLSLYLSRSLSLFASFTCWKHFYYFRQANIFLAKFHGLLSLLEVFSCCCLWSFASSSATILLLLLFLLHFSSSRIR